MASGLTLKERELSATLNQLALKRRLETAVSSRERAVNPKRRTKNELKQIFSITSGRQWVKFRRSELFKQITALDNMSMYDVD